MLLPQVHLMVSILFMAMFQNVFHQDMNQMNRSTVDNGVREGMVVEIPVDSKVCGKFTVLSLPISLFES